MIERIPDDAELTARVEALAGLLLARGRTLATAESCTGGWIAKLITDVPGSSAWFESGLVTYSNAAKHGLLGVSRAILEIHGAVSRECALAMVSGVQVRFDVDLAVAVTGVAGPSGGSQEKPVGMVWIAWQRRDREAEARCFNFSGDRDAVRRFSVAAALDGLNRVLTA